MSIEGVVDAVPAFLAKLEAHLGPALADRIAHRRLLLRRSAIFLRHVFADVLAARRHGGIELERLKVEFGAYLVLQPLQCLLERRQAYRAPRARNVGDEIDLEGCRHASLANELDHQVGKFGRPFDRTQVGCRQRDQFGARNACCGSPPPSRAAWTRRGCPRSPAPDTQCADWCRKNRCETQPRSCQRRPWDRWPPAPPATAATRLAPSGFSRNSGVNHLCITPSAMASMPWLRTVSMRAFHMARAASS